MAPKITPGLLSAAFLLLLFLAAVPAVNAVTISSITLPNIPGLQPFTTIPPQGNSPSQLATSSVTNLALTKAASTAACTAYNTAYKGLSQGLDTLASAAGAQGLVSLAISYCQLTSYNAKGFTYIPTPGAPTSGGTAAAVVSALQSLTNTQVVSPTRAVNATNAKNAPYFLTCPNTPPPSPQVNNLSIYGQDGSYVAGDECLNSVGGLPTIVTLNTQVKNPPLSVGAAGLTVPETALPIAKITPLQVSNPGLLSTYDFVYTPEVDGELSNGFSTNSYIFQGVPSYAQHAIWSWSGPFANFGAISPQTTSEDAQGQYLYVGYPNDVPDVFPGTCWIDYTYSEQTTLDWVHNVNLQFVYATGKKPDGTLVTNTGVGTPIFPYLFFNFNVTTNSLVQGQTTPNLTTLSYGVFTPDTYNSPYNSLETFPIDIPSQLIINTQLSATQDTSLWQSIKNFGATVLKKLGFGGATTVPGIYVMNSFSTNGLAIDPSNSIEFLSPQYKVLSVAVMPNDYAYFLFQSLWSGNSLGAGEYYIETARVYSTGYYQNTTVVHSTNLNTFPSPIGCETEGGTSTCTQASLQQAWTNNWIGYWSNALAFDSNSIEFIHGNVVTTNPSAQVLQQLNNYGITVPIINGAIVGNSILEVYGVPDNISVDYQGDIFIVGQTSGFAGTGAASDSYLAKFQNVNPSNTPCTNTQCFAIEYRDVNNGDPCSILQGALSCAPAAQTQVAAVQSQAPAVNASYNYSTTSNNTQKPGVYLSSITGTTSTTTSTTTSSTTTTVGHCNDVDPETELCNDPNPPCQYADPATGDCISSPSGTLGVQSASIGGTYLTIAASPTGAQVYIAGPGAGSVAVFDGSKLTYESSINLIYQSTASGSLATLDLQTWLSNKGLYNQTIPWFAQATKSYTGMLDQPSYHHVIGLSDVNGYLYVLDDWAGNPPIPTSGTGSTATTVSFNILMLRVVNSTGADVPIGGSTTPDLVVQQKCAVTAGSGLVGDPNLHGSTSGATCFTSTPPTSDCPTQAGAVNNQCVPVAITGTCLGQSGSEYGCYSSGTTSSFFGGPQSLFGIQNLFGVAAVGGTQTYSEVLQSGASGQIVYPPFGWILSANVMEGTGPNHGNIQGGSGFTFSQFTSFCASSNVCTFAPNTMPKYHGTFYPLGPNIFCGTNTGLCTSATNLPEGIGFSVSYNNTLAFLFPQNELLLANFPVENYTNVFSAYPGYACYTAFKVANGLCLYSPAVANMVQPAYFISDPFKYYENLGSPQFPSFANQFSSAFASGSGNPSSKSGASSSCLDNVGAGQLPAGCNGYTTSDISLTNLGTTISGLPGLPPANILAPVLSSSVSGFTVVPYEYQASITQGVSDTSPSDNNYQLCDTIFGKPAYAVAYAATYSSCMTACTASSIFSAGASAASCAPGCQVQGDTAGQAAEQTTDTACTTNCQAASDQLPDAYATQNPDQTWINYDYAFSPNAISPPNNAPIEGGDTYLRYTNGENNEGYYVPNLSDAGVYLDPHIFFNITGNRLFGNIYVNITSSATANAQLVVNATQQLNYETYFNTFESVGFGGFSAQNPIGSGPSLTYLTINSMTINPANYGPKESLVGLAASAFNGGLNSGTLLSTLSKLTNAQIFTPHDAAAGFAYNTITAASESSITAVTLFNWYKYEVYDNPLQLLMNGTESLTTLSACATNPSGCLTSAATQVSSVLGAQPDLPYGYRRLMFVLQDRFNNTIYAPIDADISNQTVILLNVTPVVNPLNPNMTTIYVSGEAGYYAYNTLGFVNFYPLINAPIYLYYDDNINYNGIVKKAVTLPTGLNNYLADSGTTTPTPLLSLGSLSGTSNVILAQLCTFQNALYPYISGNYVPNCQLASPINPTQVASAIVETYSPSYNSMGTCGPPAQSLLQQMDFNCNIYGAYKLPSTCSVLNTAINTAASGQPPSLTSLTEPQYCLVQSFNGNGICTSQLGLFKAAPTNALGYFSANITACGIATSTIEAQFYGSPGPEPVYSTQPPLTKSATTADPLTATQLTGLTQPLTSAFSSTPPMNSFPVYDYSWTPNETGAVVSIGLFELGFGSATAWEVLGALLIIVVCGAVKLHYDGKRRPTVQKRKHSRRHNPSKSR